MFVLSLSLSLCLLACRLVSERGRSPPTPEPAKSCAPSSASQPSPHTQCTTTGYTKACQTNHAKSAIESDCSHDRSLLTISPPPLLVLARVRGTTPPPLAPPRKRNSGQGAHSQSSGVAEVTHKARALRDGTRHDGRRSRSERKLEEPVNVRLAATVRVVTVTQALA